MNKRIYIFFAEKIGISRNKAQSLIEEVLVKVDGVFVDKPSFVVHDEANVEILPHKSYVSRGAFKLLGVIEKFKLNFDDIIVTDIGASTGGFTQVALENGARKVYAVDVGKGELDKTLAADERVVNLEGMDVRALKNEDVEGTKLVIGDLSFISLKHVFPKLNQLFGKVECVLLFKPQFECGRTIANKYRGVIKDKKVHEKLLMEMAEEIQLYDWVLSDLTFSSIKGGSGNIEYLLHLNGKMVEKFDIKEVVSEAFKTL